MILITSIFILNGYANAALKSADVAREELFSKSKSKVARTIKSAMAAVKSKKFEEARKIAVSLRSDNLFSDYGYTLAASAHREEATELLKKKKFSAAGNSANKSIELLLNIERNFPHSPFFRRLQTDLGRAELILGAAQSGQNFKKLSQQTYERAFQRLSSSNDFHLLRPENLSDYVKACSRKPSELCKHWIQSFANFYSKSSEELKAVAKLYPAVLEKTVAPKFSSKLTQIYKAPDLDLASFEPAVSKYFESKYSDATKLFRQFIDQFPNSALRYRARYWLAQAFTHEQEHERSGQLYSELIKESPLSYYGMMATINSGQNLDSRFDASLPIVETQDPSLQPIEVLRLKRAEHFVAERINELAGVELRDLRIKNYMSNPFLMYLAMLNSEVGNYSNSFVILSELIARGYDGVYSSLGLWLIFPVVNYDFIQRYSYLQKLDPVLVLSLVKQESAFDAAAVSPSGALGLMQLMPTTAIEVEPNIKRADITLVETNIRLGTKYLKKMLDRYNGNIALALASYNAGPVAIDRWVREKKAQNGLAEFIESIPYKETREYVGSIIRNYFWYSKKINGEAPKNLQYFWNVYGPPMPPPADVIPIGNTQTKEQPEESSQDNL